MEAKDVTITLHGREYRIQSPFGEEYTRTLAKYCDQKMKDIAAATGSTDYLGLSVLTLLQLAHNYHQQRGAAGKPQPDAEAEIIRLMELLDKAEKDAAEAETEQPAHTINPNVL
ncbi:MAG: cell division protein ZapA [Nitrospinae bacterium]|nr:cell division protein ZapA [Nitrospinota bacterium]